MSVLLVTHSGDNGSVEAVTQALRDLGAEPVRLDTDLYPQDARLSARLDGQGEHRVWNDGLDLDRVKALWYRRFYAGNGLPAELDETHHACLQESRQALYGTLAALDCFQVDRLAAVRRADHKEVQLKMARRFGLEIPPTLISNCPVRVREFFHEQGGEVVAKTLTSFGVSLEGEERVVFTTALREEHLAQLESLRFSPMIFQARIPKRVELRATVVGRKVFTAQVDSQKNDETAVDWRRDGIGLIDCWEPYPLPEAVQEGLLRLTEFFGLQYAAADIIVTPGGRHVFLELNAGGEWFWLQKLFPIAETLAELLVEDG